MVIIADRELNLQSLSNIVVEYCCVEESEIRAVGKQRTNVDVNDGAVLDCSRHDVTSISDGAYDPAFHPNETHDCNQSNDKHHPRDCCTMELGTDSQCVDKGMHAATRVAVIALDEYRHCRIC